EHREVLLRDRRDQVRLSARDVGVRGRELRLLESGRRQGLPGERPIQNEGVVGRQRGHALREIRRQESLLAGPAVTDPARGGERREQQAGVGRAHPPRGRTAVVQRLPIERVVLPRQRQRVCEREVGGNRLLAGGNGRTHREPDGQPQMPHGVPRTGRGGPPWYAQGRSGVWAEIWDGGGGGQGGGGARWARIYPRLRAERRGQKPHNGGSRSALARRDGISTLK